MESHNSERLNLTLLKAKNVHYVRRTAGVDWVTPFLLRASDCKLRASDCKLRASDCKLKESDCNPYICRGSAARPWGGTARPGGGAARPGGGTARPGGGAARRVRTKASPQYPMVRSGRHPRECGI